MKKNCKRPFKEKIKNIFQTISFGTGHCTRLKNQSNKFKDRKYRAVDPLYVNKNLIKRPNKMKEYIQKMINNKERTKHISIDMPNPISVKTKKMDFYYLFKNAKKILIPNGKIYITTENTELIKLFEKLAKENGFSSRPPKILKYDKTETQKAARIANVPVYSLEFTFKLTTVFPGNSKEAKEKRKNWNYEIY